MHWLKRCTLSMQFFLEATLKRLLKLIKTIFGSGLLKEWITSALPQEHKKVCKKNGAVWKAPFSAVRDSSVGNKMASKSVKIGRCFERLGKGKGLGGRGSLKGQSNQLNVSRGLVLYLKILFLRNNRRFCFCCTPYKYTAAFLPARIARYRSSEIR